VVTPEAAIHSYGFDELAIDAGDAVV